MVAIVNAGWTQETSFASIDSSTGLPSTSGLTYVHIVADEVTFEPEAPIMERSDASRRQTAEAPSTVAEGGGETIRRGRVTVRKEVECPGTDASSAAYDLAGSIFDAAAWATVLNDEGAPAAQTDTVVSATNGKQWQPTTIGNIVNGDIVGTVQSGKYRSARVTGRSLPELLAGLALPANPSGDLRLCRQFYANTGWSTSTISMQMDGVGGQRIFAFGMKLTRVEMESDDAGRLMATYTFEVAYHQVDNTNYDLDELACVCNPAFITATTFDGGVRIASEYCGKGGTLASPANSDAVSPFDVGQWSMVLDFPLEPNLGVNSNNIGIHGWRVGNPTGELTTPQCTTNDTFNNDRRNKAKRQIIIDAGTGAQGAGFSIHLNGAVLKSDPKVWERGEAEFVQRLVFQSGPYCSDTTAAPAANGVNAWLIIAWQL